MYNYHAKRSRRLCLFRAGGHGCQKSQRYVPYTNSDTAVTDRIRIRIRQANDRGNCVRAQVQCLLVFSDKMCMLRWLRACFKHFYGGRQRSKKKNGTKVHILWVWHDILRYKFRWKFYKISDPLFMKLITWDVLQIFFICKEVLVQAKIATD